MFTIPSKHLFLLKVLNCRHIQYSLITIQLPVGDVVQWEKTLISEQRIYCSCDGSAIR